MPIACYICNLTTSNAMYCDTCLSDRFHVGVSKSIYEQCVPPEVYEKYEIVVTYVSGLSYSYTRVYPLLKFFNRSHLSASDGRSIDMENEEAITFLKFYDMGGPTVITSARIQERLDLL